MRNRQRLRRSWHHPYLRVLVFLCWHTGGHIQYSKRYDCAVPSKWHLRCGCYRLPGQDGLRYRSRRSKYARAQ